MTNITPDDAVKTLEIGSFHSVSVAMTYFLLINNG